jgi:hypothetical protein
MKQILILILLFSGMAWAQFEAAHETEPEDNRDTLTIRTEKFFQGILERFEKTAEAGIMKRKHRGKVNNHFVWVLRRFPTIQSFVRTDEKDMVVNEVVRGAVPRRVRKPIEKDAWYRFIKKRKEPRETIWFNQENGRYYLVWSRPIEIGKNNRYGGTVAAIIDLWNSFHRFSKRIERPFLIIINRKILYSHEWKPGEASMIERFEVPGVRKSAIRFCREAEVVAAPEIPASEEAVAELEAEEEEAEEEAEGSEAAADEEEPEGSCGKGLLVFLVMVAALIGLGRFLYRKNQAKVDEILRNIRSQVAVAPPPTERVEVEMPPVEKPEPPEEEPPVRIVEPEPAPEPPPPVEPPSDEPLPKSGIMDLIGDEPPKEPPPVKKRTRGNTGKMKATRSTKSIKKKPGKKKDK